MVQDNISEGSFGTDSMDDTQVSVIHDPVKEPRVLPRAEELLVEPGEVPVEVERRLPNLCYRRDVPPDPDFRRLGWVDMLNAP